MRFAAGTVVAAAALSSLGACATVAHGRFQQVGIASTPAGARVTIDSVPAGVTPLVTSLSRKRAHVVRIELDGHQPFEGRLERKMSGWAIVDFVFITMVFPYVVDASTGALYTLNPRILSTELVRRAPTAPPTVPPPPWLR